MEPNYWTIPNLICYFRIGGSFALLGLAIAGRRWEFVGFYLLLAVSDLIDGPLARALGQNSSVGAALDSIADILLSACLIVGGSILSWKLIQGELLFVALAIISYLIASIVCLLKFQRLPAMHTYLAKVSHFLVAVAGVCLVLSWSIWPLRIAAIVVTITNLESLLILLKMTSWRTDVKSIVGFKQT